MKTAKEEMVDTLTIEALNLLQELPPEISNRLLEESQEFSEREAVIEYFEKSSFISRVLIKDPGTFKMLEAIYTGENFQGVIDEYFFKSLSGQALRNRLSSIISEVGKMITMEIAKKSNIKIANLGSGPGRDTVGILTENPHLIKLTSKVDCIDIDPNALEKGREIIAEKDLTENFDFIEKNLTSLQYREEVDLGLLIGILCGLDSRTCVVLLRKIKRYFKKGGKLIASNVLETMLEKDPFTSYLLKNVIGWELVYKTPEELRQIFERAGYEWKGVFYDEPTRFHAMGIGMVPLT